MKRVNKDLMKEIYDLIGEGKEISKDELRKKLEIIFHYISGGIITKELDKLSGDVVNIDELENIINNLSCKDVELEEIFNMWDKGGKKYLTMEDVKNILINFGIDNYEEVSDRMFDIFEGNTVNFKEFNDKFLY